MPQFVPFMRRFARLVPVGLAAAIAYSGVTPAEARTQQAPSSRVTIDLPEGYEPASLFSGFTHERLGVSFVVVEMPGKAYEELEAGMTPEALAAKGVRNARRLKTRPRISLGEIAPGIAKFLRDDFDYAVNVMGA